jgi:predicted nucleic acid-binding protein
MLLIVDANVLIDYANSDPGVLKLVTSHIAPIHVPAVVLDEVEQLSLEDCSDLGILVIEEPLDLLLAAAEKRGALSF